MIKAVVFDLDDTLYPEIEYVYSGFKAVADYLVNNNTNLNKDATEVFNTLKAAYKEGGNAFQRGIDKYSISNKEKELEQMVKIYREHIPQIKPYDDVEETLKWLKLNGFKLGIISDGDGIRQRVKIKALDIEKFFDQILITDELGRKEYRKPNKAAYIEMCNKLNIEAPEMIYVGDNREKDFAVGKELPLVTIEIERLNKIHNGDYLEGIHPKNRIKDLRELLPIVEEINGRYRSMANK